MTLLLTRMEELSKDLGLFVFRQEPSVPCPSTRKRVTGAASLVRESEDLLAKMPKARSYGPKVEEDTVCLRSTNRAEGRSSPTRAVAAWKFRA